MENSNGFFQSVWTQLKSIGNLSDHIDTAAADKAIRSNIYFRGPNIWILSFAIVLASVGLNVNSTAVIIGAMLISPLMGPIFGLGLGLGVNDMVLVKESGKNLLVMVIISVVSSFLYFLITPLEISNPTELLARTNPTIYDVFIALFGGFAGIFELSRKEKGTVFSGVAIATALMPPLCTAGYGLASGNFGYFMGAIYLFMINCIFIMFATYITVRYFHYEQKVYEATEKKRKSKKIITGIIVVMIVPSIWSAIVMVKENRFEQNVQKFVKANRTIGKSYIYDYNISHRHGSKVEFMLSGEMLSEEGRQSLYSVAGQYGIDAEDIKVSDSGYQAKDASGEIVKGILEVKEKQIARQDTIITSLKSQIDKIEASKISTAQIAKELANNFPMIEVVTLARGETVDLKNVKAGAEAKAEDCIVVVLDTKQKMSEQDRQTLRDGLKIRLGVSTVVLHEHYVPADTASLKTTANVESKN